MYRKVTIIMLLALFGVGISTLMSTPLGAPSDGRTGSPGDGGKTCVSSNCHFGSVTDATNIITTNIPKEGYTPGSSYTITVTLDQSGKKGLCVSPQRPDGTVMGTLTAGPGTAVVGKGYITHSATNSNIPAVWTFTWVAPAKGSGPVDFYGAFSNTRSFVRKTKVTINEASATGLSENTSFSALELFPNPLRNERLQVGFHISKSSPIKIVLYDISGKTVGNLLETVLDKGEFKETYELPVLKPGIYFVRIESESESLSRKLLIQ